MCLLMPTTRSSDTDSSPLAALVARGEELHPDLVPYLSEIEELRMALKAPLVFMVPYLPVMAHLANELYRAKIEGIRRAEAQGNWQKIIWLHERPYRLHVFTALCEHFSDQEYWEALGSIWIETENLHADQTLWLQALTADRPGRARWLMDDTDRATLAQLGDQLAIYRGFAEPGSYRTPSWSLSQPKAEWFASRAALTSPSRQGYLAATTLPKSQVLAYTNARNEREIIINPAILQSVQVTPVPQRRPTPIQ